MRVVAMVSGGKDSCYNMMQCVAEGHEIVALANLHPKDKDELDSYMYQTVGHMGIEKLAEAMGVPLFRMETAGLSKQTGKNYTPTDNDEVEDLYNLLKSTKDALNVEAVAVGAIFSDYQRVRVENVCIRLNLVPLAYLWRRDQTELLQEMIDCQVYAIIIKVASLGLVPDRHLGKSLRDIQPHLLKMKDKYGLNVCGEGGEYETFTLNCPLFKQKIVVDDMQTVISSSDPVCPVGYINFTKLRLVPKEINNDPSYSTSLSTSISAAGGNNCSGGGGGGDCVGSSTNTSPGSINSQEIPIKTSLDYLSDLNESSYNDLSDPDLSETELEQIEMENRLRESMTKEEIITNSRSNSISLQAAAAASIAVRSSTASSPVIPATIVTQTIDNHDDCDGGGGCWSDSNGSSNWSIGGGDANSIKKNPQFQIMHEQNFIKNEPNSAMNSKGWLWLSGIQGAGDCATTGMENALETIKELVKKHGYEMNSICYVTLYVRNMAEYLLLNEVYGKYFNFTNPPTRVCVQCPLPKKLHVIIELVAYRTPGQLINGGGGGSGGGDNCTADGGGNNTISRHTMHVQGISHWAPANIGPYSQSTRVGEITYISGQIALVPGSMTIVEGGIKIQCQLALRHISRIAKAMNAHGQLRDVVQGICFVTHPNYISEARRQWERRTANAIVDYIVLPALPRQALVEWQVWAHTHNDKFDYEETGCSVGGYNVFSRRRWNYESNCAAIVCYVSTGLATSSTQLTELSHEIIDRHHAMAKQLTMDQIIDILTYTLNRLLKGHSSSKHYQSENSTSSSPTHNQHQQQQQTVAQNNTINNSSNNINHNIPAIHFKIFYQVNATPHIDLLVNAVNDFRQKSSSIAKFAFTILPACSLQNFSTFLSICGIKHE